MAARIRAEAEAVEGSWTTGPRFILSVTLLSRRLEVKPVC